MLTLIAACDRNMAIGKGNEMPWHIAEDFAFFKETTLGKTVIMGRKTWDSLPRRPLPGRRNIVISRGSSGERDGALFCSLEDAIDMVQQNPLRAMFCIGGAEIYRLFLPHAQQILLTRVDLDTESPDAYFPEYSEMDWQLASVARLRSAPPQCFIHDIRHRQSEIGG
ncbi:MAG: dihydrofolate reductase [Roseibium sp.]|uniref:dihydrofolate reductase n=1 Tax=Roseibium sp. TaxID=1936156 RepID=UPI003296F5E0